MTTISELAAEIRGDNNKKESNNNQERLLNIFTRFNEDFKEVICDLIKCDVKYEACFWFKSDKDGDYYIFPPETKLDLKMNGSGGKCIADSILLTFQHNGEERKKRLFYNKTKGWYYIARNGSCINDDIYLKQHRKDLILYLDGYFEGEYK